MPAPESRERQALGLAQSGQHLLDPGKFQSLTEIAANEDTDLGHVSRIARLVRLAPAVEEAGLAGGAEHFEFGEPEPAGQPVELGGQ